MSQQTLTDKYNTYCGNCGKIGHTYRKCFEAIISLGIILHKVNYKSSYPDIRFLMIRRKDSIGYIEFMRGKYDIHDSAYMIKLLEIMTVQERENLLERDFDELLNDLIINKNYRKFPHEYQEAKSKLIYMRKNDKLKQLIENIPEEFNWTEPEWGFPKGRRHLRESDYDCACREFEEETALLPKDYLIIRNIRPLEETYIGTNNIRYKHIYFIGMSTSNRMPKINKKNKTQMAEVGDIGWFTFSDAAKKIRPYQKNKLSVLEKSYSIIKAKSLYFNEYYFEDDESLF